MSSGSSDSSGGSGGSGARFYAHGKEGLDKSGWQPLSRHLENVAALARGFADAFGAGAWAAAAGALHDYGKVSREYQDRLDGASRRVDHSTAGAQRAVDLFGPAFGRLLAACIAGHHSGLPDGKSADDSCLLKRLTNRDIPDTSGGRVLPVPEAPPSGFPLKRIDPDPTIRAFQISFFTRMLFSCLVDADFLDTERFMDPDKAAWRDGFPGLDEVARRLREGVAVRFKDPEPTEVNRLRGEVLNACRARAADPPGLFSLAVPTGGGKTVSSLAFAVEHALGHGLERIIYVIPFTSIIEQNARVFRDFLGDDAVLEHHSAFDASLPGSGGSERDENLRRMELATENWSAPLVVTTGVQFFESLFASRSSRCRKLHNIARSVIVLDEAQMLPVHFLRPCLEALRELTANYGATVVLCTATQPALARSEERRWGLDSPREIVPDPKGLYNALRRVVVSDAGCPSEDEVAGCLLENEQALCVVNTRPEARRLYERIRHAEGAFHLSALMCPEHRSRKLDEIRRRLEDGLPCRLVSTRLIEAGVDIDFPVVLRALAGIDSIAQAAGRCNREGKLSSPGRVIVYSLQDSRLHASFRIPAETGARIIRRHANPLSLEAVDDFFKELYWREKDRLDRNDILAAIKRHDKECLFPFREVAGKFRLIENDGEALIAPFDERARSAVRELRFAEFPGRILRGLQRYTIQVPLRVLGEMESSGAVERIQGMWPALTDDGVDRHYLDDIGLNGELEQVVDPASLIV